MIVSAGRCQISPHMFPQHAAQLSTLQLCLSLLPRLPLPAFTKHSQTFFLPPAQSPPPLPPPSFFYIFWGADLFFTFSHPLDQTTLTHELRLNHCLYFFSLFFFLISLCKGRLLFSVPTLREKKEKRKERNSLLPQYEWGQTLAISAEAL